MESVVLIVHLLLALAIIGLVLIQRSEGGGLGIGGSGGGMGQFASARSTANALTRATGICAAAFFATSILLAILAGSHSRQEGILDTFADDPSVIEETVEETTTETQGAIPIPPEPPSAPISE